MLKTISEAKLQSPLVLFVGKKHQRGATKEHLGCSTEPLGGRTYVCDPLHPLPDGADRNGSSLFLSILKSYIKASDRVTHVLCWERKTVRYLQSLDEQELRKLHIHDCLADFNGWIDPAHVQSGFISMIKSVSVDSKEINVVVDSLSNPLFTIGFSRCLEELQQMANSSLDNGPKIHQVLCLVHSDVLPCGASSLSHLKHLASTVVELKNQVARITHRKPGGHVEKKEEKYTILSEGQISFQPFRTSGQTDLMCTEDKTITLPQDVASFRVSLSDKEKEDRDKLVLPYMRTNEKPEGGGGGKVFYQPDAVDDWDDEDPDDDLDV